MISCTCKNCGWVHGAYSRVQAEAAVRTFNQYYYSLPVEKQQEYYGGKPASIQMYETCGLCGGKEFRPFKEGDCPEGVTISPVIFEGAL